LTEQLLTLARYDSIGDRSEPTSSLSDVISQVVSEFLPDAQARGIDLGFERLEAVAVKVDAAALGVLGRNLIDNAMRHTPRGGKIDVGVFPADQQILLRVEDTGCGIPQGDLQRVFDPFVRGSRPTGEGTGLGLAIARAIVERFGGSIALENIEKPNRSGLRVSVCFPASG
jgi:two-component system OmpR family sensor kinase